MTWFGGRMAWVAGGGSLLTYLGTAPGVGKTFAMLAEGRRRAENGEHVVVGWIESHGRPETSRQLGGLEVIAPGTVAYRGAVFADFNAPAAIASGADVVLVDELAHATADRTRQRWEDVADVLRAGLDVVTTLNVAHLRSVRDYAARIAGVGSVAEQPAPPVVVAGDSGSSWGEVVIRRAAQLARAEDAQLLVVHVQISDGLAQPPAGDLDRHRELTADLGGTYTQLQGHAPAEALAEAARAQGTATVVVGRRRSRLAELAHGSVASRLRRLLPAAAVEEVRKP